MTSNARTGFTMLAVAAGMLALAFASVPLYRVFCQVTGFGGTTQRSEVTANVVATDVPIKVRFDANVAPGLGWEFKPVDTTADIRIGERKMAFYTAENLTDSPITGVATFNVTPDTAGKYFTKIQCFCFSEQTLQPGQKVSMPVSYYVDPAILDDPSGRVIEEITLSYTFFPSRTETASRAAAETKG